MSAVVNIHHLRNRAPAPQPRDSVFFDKEDIRLGTVFRYHGANSDKGTDWTVEDIRTVLWEGGEWHERTVEAVRIWGDVIEMEEQKTGRKHTLAAVYMRYSAAWRILEA